jgi:redox-sensitive bicupin YhaK (pirin superfamily)
VTLRAGDSGLGALVLRGTPLKEPIVHYGPFVMNTPEQIETTLRQYRDGTFLTAQHT